MKKRRTVPSVNRQIDGVPLEIKSKEVNEPVSSWPVIVLGLAILADIVLAVLMYSYKIDKYGKVLGFAAILVSLVVALSHFPIVCRMACEVWRLGNSGGDWLLTKAENGQAKFDEFVERLEKRVRRLFG